METILQEETTKGGIPLLVAIVETSWLEKEILEEAFILPTTSIALQGLEVPIPKKLETLFQKRLEEEPKAEATP